MCAGSSVAVLDPARAPEWTLISQRLVGSLVAPATSRRRESGGYAEGLPGSSRVVRWEHPGRSERAPLLLRRGGDCDCLEAARWQLDIGNMGDCTDPIPQPRGAWLCAVVASPFASRAQGGGFSDLQRRLWELQSRFVSMTAKTTRFRFRWGGWIGADFASGFRLSRQVTRPARLGDESVKQPRVVRGVRKVRAPQDRAPGNAWGVRTHGKCSRKQTAAAFCRRQGVGGSGWQG